MGQDGEPGSHGEPIHGMPSPIPPLPLGLLGLAKEIGQAVPGIAPDAQRTGAEALAIMSDLFGHMFPHVSTPSRS